MKILNSNGSTRLLGSAVPNVIVWLLMVFGVFIAIKIGNIFNSMIGKMKSFLGFDDTEQRDEVQKQIIIDIKKSPAVQSQMTTENAHKAQRLEQAIQGFGVDDDEIYAIFDSITGPNMMKAIYSYFGTRTIRVLILTETGDLPYLLRDRLWSYQLNKKLKKGFTINQKLSWI